MNTLCSWSSRLPCGVVVVALLPVILDHSGGSDCDSWYSPIVGLPGSSQERITWPSPGAADSFGAAGTITAVAVDTAPSPEGFTARSANVYVTPLSSPVMVYEVVAALLPPSKSEKFAPPSVLYWYFVIVALPGSSQERATSPSPGVAERLTGAAGKGTGVAVSVAAPPKPDGFTARTANVYVMLLVRPVTSWYLFPASSSGILAHPDVPIT